ncbi:hypothetical protein [Nocardioides convexus]|uniref:hypothetical protein n=1 Tax=Nocardioides convexus TaxID=2712224 RepID=UPI002418553D|nr:hypothetical protein [Nocardioides convexus]
MRNEQAHPPAHAGLAGGRRAGPGGPRPHLAAQPAALLRRRGPRRAARRDPRPPGPGDADPVPAVLLRPRPAPGPRRARLRQPESARSTTSGGSRSATGR